MFDNRGKRLQVFAKVVFWLFVAVGVFFAYAGCINTKELLYLLFIPTGVLTGFLFALPMYAFGNLVENTEEIRKSMNQTTMVWWISITN